MLDVAPSEFLLLAVVALVVIGPKDLPKALRVLGYWVGRARGVARQFRSGFDNMVREAELADMEKKWAAENERIMKEHSEGVVQEEAQEPSHAATVDAGAVPPHADEAEVVSRPVMVEKPQVEAAPSAAPAADAKAPS